MADVSSIDLSTTCLGVRLAMPFVIGPTGLNGAFRLEGDLCIAHREYRAGAVGDEHRG